MYIFENVTFLNFFTSLLAILATYLIFAYNWRRRWLYYYGSKLPGPFGFPLVGSVHVLLDGRTECLNTVKKLVVNYPPIFKIWLGIKLYIFTTRPQDVEIILQNALSKGDFYEFIADVSKQSLLVAPVDVWKERRKMINQTFSSKIINSFVPLFAKQTNSLVDKFNGHCKQPFDVFSEIWKTTFDAACETLGDLNSHLLSGKDEILSEMYRFEESLTKRFYNPLLHPKFFWRMSSLHTDGANGYKKTCDFIQQMINVKVSTRNDGSENLEDSVKRKIFLNFLLQMVETNNLKKHNLFEETVLMLGASSETTAVAMSSVLLILGMHPEVQEKIFEELSSIFNDTFRDATLADVNRMEYLERVIKETMRVLPPIPLFLRTVDKDISLDSYILPAGCRVVIPAMYLHRREDLWPDPLKFDPDRFLPEEIKKRHRCAYIPFSFGSRNCIGLKYGMLSIKAMLSGILRHYKVVETIDYKEIEEVDLMYYMVGKAKKGYRIILEKRNGQY